MSFWCYFWAHFGIILVSFWYHFWGHSGVILGSFWCQFGGIFGFILDLVKFAVIWVHFCFVLYSVWYHICDHLRGQVRGHSWRRFDQNYNKMHQKFTEMR